MKLKTVLMAFGILFAVFLVACARAPASTPVTTEPSGQSAAGSAGAGATIPAAPEAKFKITKQSALKNPSRVMFTIENSGEVDSSTELTVGLVYARKIVASKTTTVSLKIGESKDVVVEFPETSTFVSYTIEGAGLINPVRPAGLS
jgi:hypothetical protein